MRQNLICRVNNGYLDCRAEFVELWNGILGNLKWKMSLTGLEEVSGRGNCDHAESGEHPCLVPICGWHTRAN